MNGNNPLVSVLIPAYNHEKYIQETINSIVNQTYQNIELIIVDDGSKDSTWQKIQEMKEVCEKRFVNVHFETQNNSGICTTLNKLIKEANGEYVYLIASDDLAKPFAIEREIGFLENNPDYSLAVGDNEIIDSESRVCYWDDKRRIVYEPEEAVTKSFVEYLKQRYNNFNDNNFGKYYTFYKGNYVPNGYLIRKSIYDIIGLYPEGFYLEDYWFMLQVSKYSKMKYIDEILFSYRWHDSNTIKNTEKMQLIEKNTLELESDIQKNINKKLVLVDVVNVIENGVLYKKQGIPFIFQILSFKKFDKKIKIFKLFGIKIFEYVKARQ